MSATSTERPSSSKLESKKQKSALSRGNTTQAQKSNQAASSAVVMVAAGQRLMSIPEQLFGDETASNSPLQWTLGWDNHNGGTPPWVTSNLPVAPWEVLPIPLPGE
ncbi:hypothetical protein EV359DRAFT_68889 [Lentinula novae-zelandiae]|nr:hypothetical protein EV359DRAFT_68889 [Lentinula novae-zelandiae]